MKDLLRKILVSMPVFFPLYLWKFDVFGVPFNVVEVMVYITFGLFVYVRLRGIDDSAFGDKLRNFFMRKKTIKDVFKTKLNTFFLPIFLLILASGFGLVVSYYGGEFRLALGIFKGWVVMPVLYGIMLVFTLNSLEDKKKIFYSYMFSTLILSVWALYQVISKDFVTIDGRASGPFASANYLALYIGPMVCGAFINFWQRVENKLFSIDTRDPRTGVAAYLGKFFDGETKDSHYDYAYFAFEVLVFLASSLALMYSRSYGGMIGVVSAIFIYAVYEIFFSQYRRFYGSLFKKLVVICAGAVLIVTAMYSQIGTQKAKDFLQFDRQSSSSVRIQVWTVAGILIKENPLFGIGLGGFENAYKNNAKEILGVEPYEKEMLHAHNLILSTYLNV
ncbi:MAG TPA: O-antigen ligase family protein, partial [Candidatus Gracilibacteria bacterium]|nr:O-antigen ligase family protein [Candidatus Gracilibacteria bacterium]